MLIAVVATVHVLVSHYAVGGGFFLALETQHAYKTHNAKYLNYLRKHAWFFVLVTVAFGAITGVGIWWTIGLASPLATQVLIQTFVFGWAWEYCAFIVEIVAALIFFYYWGRLDAKTHTTIGWIYAGAAWISLFLITGITAFMLNPGNWQYHRTFWTAFFNPQLIPQVLSRTGGSFLLASLYVYLHAAFKEKDPALRNHIAMRSARPALLGSALISLGGILWFKLLPQSALDAVAAASSLNILMTLVFAVTVAVFVMLYLGPYRNPGWISPGFGILFFAFGLVAVSSGEFIREAVRKPYIVYNTVMSNQIMADEIPQLRQTGYLEGGVWTKALVKSEYPQVMTGNTIDQTKLPLLPDADRVKLGAVLYQHHCNDCHAVQDGISGMDNMTRGWTQPMILDVCKHPEQSHFFMPPWAGTDTEAQLLAEYIQTLSPESPKGMNYGSGGDAR